MGGPLIRSLLWMAVLLASPVALAQDPSPTELAWAKAEQESLPALDARKAAADARVHARQAWFDRVDGASFEQAFSGWAGSPLNRPAALTGALAGLSTREVQRASERKAPVPTLGREDREADYAARRDAALSAEAAADALERRLLVEALAVLDTHPELSASRLAGLRNTWSAAANREIPQDGPPDAIRAVQETAARADRWLRSLDALIGRLVRASVRDAALPTVDPTLLKDPIESEEAAIELGLLAPFLSGDAAEAAQLALIEYWSDRTWDEPVDRVLEAERIAKRLEGLDERAPWQQSRKRALTERLEALKAKAPTPGPAPAQVDGVPAEVVDPGDVARVAEREAAAAQQEADDALAGADDARARRRAEVLQALATARRRSAELWGQAETRQTEARVVDEKLDEALATIDNQVSAIRNRRLGEAAPNPDEVYRKVRTLSQELRGGPEARGTHLIEARQVQKMTADKVSGDRARIVEAETWIATTPDRMARAELDAALEAWSEALLQESKAASNLSAAATLERDAALRGLSRLREQRRTLRGWASAAALREDGGYLLLDVAQELRLLGPSVVMRVRDRAQQALELPSRLTDFNLLRGVLGASLWTLLWIGAWVWARGQAKAASALLSDRLQSLRPELRPGDLAALRDPIARFVRAFVDLLLGWLLIGQIGELVPELGFLLLVYLQVALYRATLAAFDLCVVPSNQVRPAILVVRPSPFELARRTFRYAVGLAIARAFLYRLLWDVLGLDVVAGLVTGMFTLAVIALVVWALYQWEPHLRVRIRRRNQDSKAVALLARDPESPLVQPLRGAAILAFLGVAGVVDLAFWLGRERSGLAWLVHAFSRFSEPEESLHLSPLDPEVAEAISRQGSDLTISRPAVRVEVAAAIEQWRREGRRGLVALVGDRGSCKSLACDEVAQLLGDCELLHKEVTCDRRLVTEAEMVAWLVEVLELPPCDSSDAVVAHLLELPQQAWILRNAHRAWARRVEGFGAITTLLYVLNATSHLHFWVLSMHRLSWDFFASTGSLVDVGVVRTVIPLAPLGAPEIREICMSRATALGYRLDTSGLLRSSVFGSDPSVDEERGVHLFFRLLAEAAQGNPTVALRLWSRCLHPTEDPEVLLVHSGDALDAAVIPNLTDAALFTLVALRVQDDVGEEELVEVTNLPAPIVRATVRDLMGRGLVQSVDRRLSIPDVLLPAVSRTLRRRHFLHLGAA